MVDFAERGMPFFFIFFIHFLVAYFTFVISFLEDSVSLPIYLCKYEEYLNSAEFAANSCYSEVPSSEIWNAVRINQHLRSWNRGGQTNEFFLNSNGIR